MRNHDGRVFEDDKPDTLAEALSALEKSIAKWFKEQEIGGEGRK